MKGYNYPPFIPISTIVKVSRKILKNPIPVQHSLFEKYGDTYTVRNINGQKIILTRDFEIAKYITQKNSRNYRKSDIQSKHLAKYVGYGLLTSNGEYWKQQRRLIQPAFYKEKLKSLLDIMENCIKNELKQLPVNTPVDVYKYMNLLAFRIVAQSLFNFSIDEKTTKRIREIVESNQLFFVKELRDPILGWWLKITGQQKKQLKLSKEVRAILLNVILERRESKEDHNDLLDMLLNVTYEDGSKMTDQQLIDEILILFIAGHETTANALTFSLGLLSRHKNDYEKIVKEAKELNGSALFEKLTQSSYARACVDESMRLYPPAWILDRVNLEDDTIGGYKISKGTVLGASLYEIHRSENYWEQPNAFQPERFLNSDNQKKSSTAYLPFGAGPRFCIGNGFAIFEMIMVLQHIAEIYDIEPKFEKIDYNPLITLKPIDIKIQFTPKA